MWTTQWLETFLGKRYFGYASVYRTGDFKPRQSLIGC